MKVFISWSGGASRELAEALHWWLPKVIQGTQPFVSAKDIDKGANWSATLAQELEDTDFGVVCLTSENLASPWLHYEAGAISKSVNARVCPILLNLEKSAIDAPLNQLQLTELEWEDVRLMVRSMNSAAGSPLSDADLDEAVDMWWPKLEERVKAIKLPTTPPTKAAEPAQPEPGQPDMLKEILDLTRDLHRRTAGQGSRRRASVAPHSEPTGTNRDWTNDLFDELYREGVMVKTMVVDPQMNTVKIEVESLPSPLPGNTWQLLRQASMTNAAEIEVSERGRGGRVIEFSRLGNSDEPPF